MNKKQSSDSKEKMVEDFLSGKSESTIALFNYFIHQYKLIGEITLHPAKTMIGIATQRKRIAYVTQLGKNFIHVVFPFETPHTDNLCFKKIAQVPGDTRQFNHHFRMYTIEDVNKEVLNFMQMAYELGV